MRLLVVKSMLGSAACSSSGDSWSADRILGSGGGRGGNGWAAAAAVAAPPAAAAAGLAAAAAAAAVGVAAVDPAPPGVAAPPGPRPLLKGRHAWRNACCRSGPSGSGAGGESSVVVFVVPSAAAAEQNDELPRHMAASALGREADVDAAAASARDANSSSALPARARGADIFWVRVRRLGFRLLSLSDRGLCGGVASRWFLRDGPLGATLI